MMKKLLLAAILLSLAGTAYLFLRPDLTLPKEQVKAAYRLPNSHFIQWKGAELHYTLSGPDTAMTILMIHGFGGSHRDFDKLDSLLNHSYRIVRMDLPGFGLSDYPFDYATKNIREAYTEYFDMLKDTLGIDSCIVMGNSLGGMISVELATSRPETVKALVLFNSAGYEMEEVMKSANAYVLRNPLVRTLAMKGMSRFMTHRGMKRVVYDHSLLTPERITRVNSMWNREGNMRHLVELANSNEFPDEAMMKDVRCPTLIIWGQQDQIVNVKYAARFHEDIPGSRLVIYDPCGHVPMQERPKDVYRDVMDFLME
jgi:pimeloyl-ACP methyl ester carboxylesterase